METNGLNSQDRPVENSVGVITPENARKLLQNTFDLPKYNSSTGLGINLPYFHKFSEDFPNRIKINSFGTPTEIKAYPILSGIGILRDILAVQDTDIDGKSSALVTIDLDGSDSHPIPLVVVLKDRTKLSGRQTFGVQIDNSKKDSVGEWIV